MSRNLLFKLVTGGMFLTGALGIIYSIHYFLVDKPTGVTVETAENGLQLDEEHTPLYANGKSVRHEEKKNEVFFHSTPTPSNESAFVVDVDVSEEKQKSGEVLPSKSSVSEAKDADKEKTETRELILQIRELESKYEDYTQQLEGIEEQRQGIFELGQIHDKTPEKIAELVNRLTTDQTLSEYEKRAIVEQLRRLSLGANSRADELDEMVRETREESDAIWAQRESVHAELNSLRSLLPAEVRHEK